MVSILELKALLLKFKLLSYFNNNLKEFKIVRQQIYEEQKNLYSNILIKIKWNNNFKGPDTILIMYKNNNKDIFYETYLYFNKHKPSHLTNEEFNIVKEYSDIIRHFNVDELLNDINIENSLSSI